VVTDLRPGRRRRSAATDIGPLAAVDNPPAVGLAQLRRCPTAEPALAARRWLAAGLDRFDKGVEFEPIGERVAFEEEIENLAAAAPANMRARRAAKLGSKRRLKPIVSGALVLATTSRQRRIRSTSRATGPRRCRSGHVCTPANGERSARG
jgi:hypothetical protein